MQKVKKFLTVLTSAPVRRGVYAIVAAGFTLAFAIGVGTEQDQSVVMAALDNGYQLLTALAALMAAWKTSDLPTVYTLEAPDGSTDTTTA